MKNYISLATRSECDYGPAALRLVKDPRLIRLLHAAMGLSTESGELLDALKKHIYYGKDLDLVNLLEESGDLFWYLAIIADALGHRTFFKIMSKNIAKLQKRYPEKFTEGKANTRDLTAERGVLEGAFTDALQAAQDSVQAPEGEAPSK